MTDRADIRPLPLVIYQTTSNFDPFLKTKTKIYDSEPIFF